MFQHLPLGPDRDVLSRRHGEAARQEARDASEEGDPGIRIGARDADDEARIREEPVVHPEHRRPQRPAAARGAVPALLGDHGGSGVAGGLPVAAAIDGETPDLHGRQDGEHAPGPEAPDEPGRETHTKPGIGRRDRLTESLELAGPPVRLGRRLGAELGEEPSGLAGLHGGEPRIEVPGHSLGLEAGPDDVGSARHGRPPAQGLPSTNLRGPHP